MEVLLNGRLIPGRGQTSSQKTEDYPVGISHCFEKVGRHSGLVLAQDPGAGVGEIEPYDRVLKDGFMKIACVKDSMFLYADKFGGNKHEYRVGPTQNVSIVHYNDHVAKEDREPITPTVCFNFCRTIDDMGYFGILNGRECYCEPYYKPLAGDSSGCDSVCDGDNAQMCGGQSKSNIWEMHMCNDAAQVLAATALEAYAVQVQLDDLIPRAMDAAHGKQELAVDLQEEFGQLGDPAAANLMQKSKVSAGNLLHLAEQAEESRNSLRGIIRESVGMTGVNPSSLDTEDSEGSTAMAVVTELVPPSKAEKFATFDVAKKGDELTKKLQAASLQANETYKSLQKLYLLSEPMINPSFHLLYGNCIVDDTGCIKSRTDSRGYYYRGDWCAIEVRDGSADIEVKTFDVNPWRAALVVNQDYYYRPGDDKRLKEVKAATGYIYWFTSYWTQPNKPGFEICAVQKKESDEDRGLQYYPAMYFVDKDFVDAPMTCEGTLVEQPIYFKNYNGCAAACDARNQNCVGFSYFPTGRNKPNLCFLYSSFKTGQYYTGCSKQGPPRKSLLQVDADQIQPITDEPDHPICVAKLSKFVGTTLKPDPAGKCEQCFKEITKANRCP